MNRSLAVVLRVAAWVALAAVLIVTVSPPELRPHVWSANVERFAAFAVCGGLFAAAYPRRWAAICCLVLLSAALFELAQALVPDRHPAMKDFVVKAIGGGIGITAGLFVHELFRFRYGQQVRCQVE
jgi:VanZ family protein